MPWKWSGWSKGSSIQARSAPHKAYWTAFHRELSETHYLTPLLALLQQLGEPSVSLATLVRALNPWSGSSHNDPTFRPLRYKHLWHYGGWNTPPQLMLSLPLPFSGFSSSSLWQPVLVSTLTHPRNTMQLQHRYIIVTWSPCAVSMLTFYMTVLVLAWSGIQSRMNCWRVLLVLVDIICFHHLVHPSVFVASGDYQARWW